MLHILSAQFQQEAKAKSLAWDREWCRYFAEPYARNFFSDMSSPDRQLRISAAEFAKYSPRDFYFANVTGEYAPEVWIDPGRIIGRRVFELGCGPGTFGKIAGKICEHYYGVDYSPLALHVAQILSPANCTFLHLSQTERLLALRKQVDTIVSRHFFIHQNLSNARWILELYAYVLADRGQAVLDFWPYPPDQIVEGTTVQSGDGPLCTSELSCIYHFTDNEIRRVLEDAGFKLMDSVVVPEVHRKF